MVAVLVDAVSMLTLNISLRDSGLKALSGVSTNVKQERCLTEWQNIPEAMYM